MTDREWAEQQLARSGAADARSLRAQVAFARGEFRESLEQTIQEARDALDRQLPEQVGEDEASARSGDGPGRGEDVTHQPRETDGQGGER